MQYGNGKHQSAGFFRYSVWYGCLSPLEYMNCPNTINLLHLIDCDDCLDDIWFLFSKVRWWWVDQDIHMTPQSLHCNLCFGSHAWTHLSKWVYHTLRGWILCLCDDNPRSLGDRWAYHASSSVIAKYINDSYTLRCTIQSKYVRSLALKEISWAEVLPTSTSVRMPESMIMRRISTDGPWSSMCIIEEIWHIYRQA